MNKLYDRIYWHNNTTPALNESNLNSMSKALDDIDDRVIQIADDIVDDIADIHQWHDETYQYKQDAEQSASDAQGYASSASTSSQSADDSAEDSEAWAVGKRDGTDVPSSDPTYHNNSKYYAEQSEGFKDDCEDIKDEIIDAIGVPIFTVNFTTGELEYDPNITYNFTINTTTGNLEWEVVA